MCEKDSLTSGTTNSGSRISSRLSAVDEVKPLSLPGTETAHVLSQSLSYGSNEDEDSIDELENRLAELLLRREFSATTLEKSPSEEARALLFSPNLIQGSFEQCKAPYVSILQQNNYPELIKPTLGIQTPLM